MLHGQDVDMEGRELSSSQILALRTKDEIKQFQQKVNHCSQTFVVSELETTLQEIFRKTQKKIRSIYGLRTFVERTQVEKGHALEKEVMYTNWFLENLSYLKDLKAHFSVRIYLPLARLFLIEHETVQQQLSAVGNHLKVFLKVDHTADISAIFNHNDLQNVVTRLRYLTERLDHLFEDDNEVDPAMFSVTSAHSVEDLRQPNDAFLRLLPDILQKMTTAAKLAEKWLEIISHELSDGTTILSKLDNIKLALTARLDALNRDLEKLDNELSTESDELQELLTLEDRTTIIANKSHALEVKATKLKEKMIQNSRQMVDIRELLKTASGNQQFMSNLLTDLKRKERLHDEMQRMSQLIEFERNLVAEDLSVELEIKPSLIRITSNVQDRCEELEASIEETQSEKYKLELALRPVNTPSSITS